MHTVSVDFEVFKALTVRLEYEGQTHNDVLRELLGLDSIIEETPPEPAIVNALAAWSRDADQFGRPAEHGFFSRGLFLPDGTKLRARYKGKQYHAVIQKDHWVDQTGQMQASPSAAATAITETNVNGLRFWEALRPGDTTWRRLEFIRNRQVHGEEK